MEKNFHKQLFEAVKNKIIADCTSDGDRENFLDFFDSCLGIHKVESGNIYIIVKDALIAFRGDKFFVPLMNKARSEFTEEPYRFLFITAENADRETKEREKTYLPSTPQFGDRNLRPDFTFDLFVVGDSNRFAYTSAMNVARSSLASLNPLYIFGGVGLGKTHLMMAIGHYALQNDSSKNVVYTTAKDFTEEYFRYTNINKSKIEDFYKKYNEADLLLVDDIQFLQGKEATQGEFFKIFDRLHGQNVQIVLTSDRPANSLDIMDRLSSRFAWGLVTDIQAPDYNLRLAILKNKLQTLLSNPNEVDPKALERIAELFTDNVRELEGALRRYINYCVSLDLPFTVENVNVALEAIVQKKIELPQDDLKIAEVKQAVSNYFKIPVVDLESKSRQARLVYARNLCYYIIREHFNTPLKQIGDHFGGRDHTTISHGYDKIKYDLDSDQGVAMDLKVIKSYLNL